MKKLIGSLKPPLITIVELQILNSYKKMVLKKEKNHYHNYYHHHHLHRHNHCCHYHQFHHHHHSLSAPPGAIPVWGPSGWKKKHYNHHRHHCHHHNHHHNHHHHNHYSNNHCHSFSSPLWCWLCLRPFGKLNFRAKLYWIYITIKAKRLHIWHPRGILNKNLF